VLQTVHLLGERELDQLQRRLHLLKLQRIRGCTHPNRTTFHEAEPRRSYAEPVSLTPWLRSALTRE